MIESGQRQAGPLRPSIEQSTPGRSARIGRHSIIGITCATKCGGRYSALTRRQRGAVSVTLAFAGLLKNSVASQQSRYRFKPATAMAKMNFGQQMTNDEKIIASVEARIRSSFKDGEPVGEISRADLEALLNSRLAWKFTAKYFAASKDD